MKTEMFDELLESTKEALEHAEGKRSLRTTRLPLPPQPMHATDVKRVRNSLNASQAVLARYLNVSPKSVQAWEANRRQPTGPALVLLRLVGTRPDVIETLLEECHAK